MINKTLILTAAMLFSTNLFCISVNIHNGTKSRILVRPYDNSKQPLRRDCEDGYCFMGAGEVLTFDAGVRIGLLGIPIVGTAGDCQVDWEDGLKNNYSSRVLKNPASITIKDNGAYSTWDEQGTVWPFRKNNEEIGRKK